MLDGKPVQLPDQFLRSPMKLLQGGTFDLVLPPNLLYQQLRIANDLKCLAAIVQRILQSGEQPVVLGIVIGLPAKILTECGNLVAGLIFDDDAVPGRTRIPPRSTINVGDQIRIGSIAMGWKGTGTFTRHAQSVQRSWEPAIHSQPWVKLEPQKPVPEGVLIKRHLRHA